MEVVWGICGDVGVDEIGSGLSSFHGESCSVISQSSFLGGVKSAKPVSFFGGGVSDLGGVSAPRPPSYPEEASGFGLFSSASSFSGLGWGGVALEEGESGLGVGGCEFVGVGFVVGF